ncbi:hypothetical protein B0H17DRAFT_953262, partial [Mycena rosella]
YMARIDFHLIHGCEITSDSKDIHVNQLTKVQVRFIRHMLSLHNRSMITPLFTETGITPIRVQRFQIILTHLMHYACAALDSPPELSARGKRFWAKNLITAASRPPFPCPELVLDASTSIEDVQDYAKTLQSSINSADKLYLLHRRLELQKDKPPTQINLIMCHYLTMVKTQKHREALTSILLSIHQLAIEILCSVNHAYQPMPQANRLCRFCKKEVETPEHVLLKCTSLYALVDLQRSFLEKLLSKCPELQ